jgi:hypothetical protein
MARSKKVQEEEVEEIDDLELEVVEKKPRKKATKTTKAPAKKSRSKKDADDDDDVELMLNEDDDNDNRKAETQERAKRPPREPIDATRPAKDMSTQDLLRYLMERGAEALNPTLRIGASNLLNELTRGPGRRRGGQRYGSKTAPPLEPEQEQTYTRSRPRYGSKTSAVRHNSNQRQSGSKTNQRNRDGIY